jgi:phosphoglycerate dehydrogenase-like enzyme
VFDPEPLPAGYPLLGFDNVLLTPHMAARPHTAVDNMSWVIRDVMEVLNGRPAKYPAPRGAGNVSQSSPPLIGPGAVNFPAGLPPTYGSP